MSEPVFMGLLVAVTTVFAGGGGLASVAVGVMMASHGIGTYRIIDAVSGLVLVAVGCYMLAVWSVVIDVVVFRS